MRATRDEVAGDCHRARRVGTRIVVTRDVITTGLNAVIKRDATGQSYDCIWRGQLDGGGPVDVTTREAVKDEVIGDGDAVGQLETSVAVGVGTCRRSDCNRAGRQTQRILHLDVASRDEEVTREVMVNGGIKDQATRTNLREVSRARQDTRGGISRGGPNIECHFTSQRDNGARPDRTIGRGRQGGARLERNCPGQGIRRDPHADFQGRPRLDGDDTRKRRAGEELRGTEDAERAGGDGDITFRDGRAVHADEVTARLGQREAREVEVEAVTVEVPALGAADGGVRRERHRLQGVRLGEVRVIDNRTRIADARSGDGHRPARERDAVSDRRTREVQRGARGHRDGSTRSAQGGIAANADRAAIDGRRTRVGVGVTQDKQAVAVLRQAVRARDDAREAEGTRGVGDADSRDTNGRSVSNGFIA